MTTGLNRRIRLRLVAIIAVGGVRPTSVAMRAPEFLLAQVSPGFLDFGLSEDPGGIDVSTVEGTGHRGCDC